MFGRKKRDDLEYYALSPEEQEIEDAELLAIIDAQLAAEEAACGSVTAQDDEVEALAHAVAARHPDVTVDIAVERMVIDL